MSLRYLCTGSFLASVFAKPDGTCGYECTADADCGGCGTSGGSCSCPNGLDATFSECACSCVSAPSDPPADPAALAEDSVWPPVWSADVDSWTYGTFEHNVSEAHGKFYYDENRQATRSEWKPYITGGDATQIWITNLASGVSNYYVDTPQVCIYFAITDPGQDGKPVVGIEKSTWMRDCHENNWATYVGREQVNGEWADHWSCRIEYPAAKNPDNTTGQTITFQNWHALGLGDNVKGLPVRVTGGNSKPDPQQGSPRLNTVWYSNFDTSDSATSDEMFQPPAKFCIPVGAAEAKSFLGSELSADLQHSSHFHKQALDFARSHDLKRAKQPKPSKAFTGASFTGAMGHLNNILKADKTLATKECKEFSTAELQEVQNILFASRSPSLDVVYQNADDTRKMAHDLASLQDEQLRHRNLEGADREMMHDGACHEAVMWWVHHLSEKTRQSLKKEIQLPLLPSKQHQGSGDLHQRYSQQVSCAVCHVAPDSIAV